MRPRGLTTRIVALAGLLGLLILVFVTWEGYRSNLNQMSESRWVNRTYHIIMELVRVRAGLEQVLAARQLYGLTGNDAYLDEYRRLDRDIRARLEHVNDIAVDPEARQVLEELQPAVLAALRSLGEERSLGGDGVRTGLTRANRLLARMLALEQELLRVRDARAIAASRETRSIVLFGSGFAILLTLAAAYLLYTHLKERGRALAALSASEARNRGLIDAIPDILIRASAEGAILTFKPPVDDDDPEWVKAMVGRRIPEVLPPDVADALMQGVHGSLRENTSQRVEFVMPMAHVRPDNPNNVDFEARFVPVGQCEVLIIARDISDRKRVERMKNEFVSTVSHELRTPLTSIRGSLSLIASGVLGELQPRGQKLVEIALNNSERLVRLINDILDIEKIESGKLEFQFQQVELPTLVARAIEDNRAYAQPFAVPLEQQGTTRALHVWGDPDRLLQVLTNLISNAVKFSPKGEAVTVTIEEHGERVRVAVRDRGPGIPAEFRGRIFQRFAQADSADNRQRGGTGLGLSISKAIIDRHGGTINFSDHPQGGTVFTFELPLHATPAPRPSEPSAPGRKVLVCEDDPDIAHLLQLILTRANIASDVAHSAEDAEQLLRDHPYDALVLDLLLPGKDGIAFIRQLRRQPETATLPIVVLSAVADQSKGTLNGDALSVVDWINKPIDTDRLLSAVRLATPRHDSLLRVLHVDDDPDLREVVRELLRGAATTTPVGSVAEAREQLRTQQFDLVLLDLGLPDGSGLELLPQLREEHPPVPVLVFSARELDRASAERVAATLVKSRTSNDQLLETIRALIDSHHRPGGPNAQ